MPPPQDYGSGNCDCGDQGSANQGSANQGSPARSARPRTSKRVWTPAPGRGGSCSPCVRPLQSDRQSIFPCTSLSPLARIPTDLNRFAASLFGDSFYSREGTTFSRAINPSLAVSGTAESRALPSNSLRRPQFCAAGPRVAINLFFSGRHWFLCQQPVLPQLRALAHRIFHDAVFQRVKADH